MVWKRLFGKRDSDAPPAPPEPQPDAQGIIRRQRPAADPAMQQRLDALRRRRDMAAYDLERAELAHLAENPWRERIGLLDQSLAAIEKDLQDLEHVQPLPPITLPETPIAAIDVRLEEPLSVSFQIGDERFLWEEEIDWDQRGGPVVRGQIRQRSGDAARLVPDDIPDSRRDELIRHLQESLDVFALDLRERSLEGTVLPTGATLADLARPCPVCGDWLDWKGHCDACARRAWQRQNLKAEAARIEREREDEESDRHKWAERLPVARKRLADIDEDIAALERG
jgi:hypothetical protein